MSEASYARGFAGAACRAGVDAVELYKAAQSLRVVPEKELLRSSSLIPRKSPPPDMSIQALKQRNDPNVIRKSDNPPSALERWRDIGARLLKRLQGNNMSARPMLAYSESEPGALTAMRG